MTEEDALLALQRHFEEQYGKLEMPEVRRRKRKRNEETEPPKQQPIESDEGWGGIQNKVAQPNPEVVEFKETQKTDTLDTKSYKSFMVTSLSYGFPDNSVF